MGAQFFRRAQPGLPVRRPVRNSRAPRSSTVLLIGPRRHELAHPTSQTCAALRPPQPKKKQSFSSNCPKSFPEFLLQRLIQPLVINFLSHATSTLLPILPFPRPTASPPFQIPAKKSKRNRITSSQHQAGLKKATHPREAERGQNGCQPPPRWTRAASTNPATPPAPTTLHLPRRRRPPPRAAVPPGPPVCTGGFGSGCGEGGRSQPCPPGPGPGARAGAAPACRTTSRCPWGCHSRPS